jgi:hypothetical protein
MQIRAAIHLPIPRRHLPFSCAAAKTGSNCGATKHGQRAQKMRWIIRIAAFIAIVVVLGLGALVAVPTERVAGASWPTG